MRSPLRQEWEAIRDKVCLQAREFGKRKTDTAQAVASIAVGFEAAVIEFIGRLDAVTETNTSQLELDLDSAPEPEPPADEPVPTLPPVFKTTVPAAAELKVAEHVLRARCSGLGLGDALIPLSAFQVLGGGEYHITCFKSPFSWSPEHPYSNDDYRTRTYYALAEFVDAQPYISKCEAREYIADEEFDVDFDGIRKIWGTLTTGKANALEMGARWLNIDVDLSMQWLWPVENTAPGFDGKILVSATNRRPVHYLDFKFLADYRDRLVFVGLDSDYDYWLEHVGIKMDRFEAKDFVELAAVLNTVDLFLASSSAPAVVADGMNVPIVALKSAKMAHFRPFTDGSVTVSTSAQLEKEVRARVG